MDHFAGLDVSIKETSVCIVDHRARSKEVKVASEPEALLKALANPTFRFNWKLGRCHSGSSVLSPMPT
jgi:transposase